MLTSDLIERVAERREEVGVRVQHAPVRRELDHRLRPIDGLKLSLLDPQFRYIRPFQDVPVMIPLGVVTCAHGKGKRQVAHRDIGAEGQARWVGGHKTLLRGAVVNGIDARPDDTGRIEVRPDLPEPVGVLGQQRPGRLVHLRDNEVTVDHHHGRGDAVERRAGMIRRDGVADVADQHHRAGGRTIVGQDGSGGEAERQVLLVQAGERQVDRDRGAATDVLEKPRQRRPRPLSLHDERRQLLSTQAVDGSAHHGGGVLVSVEDGSVGGEFDHGVMFFEGGEAGLEVARGGASVARGAAVEEAGRRGGLVRPGDEHARAPGAIRGGDQGWRSGWRSGVAGQGLIRVDQACTCARRPG
nr:hypothetical protein [Roseomonas nepalensis]